MDEQGVDQRNLVSLEQLADMLLVERTRVRKWAKADKIPIISVDGTLYVSQDTATWLHTVMNRQTVREVSEQLRISLRTVRARIADGDIEAVLGPDNQYYIADDQIALLRLKEKLLTYGEAARRIGISKSALCHQVVSGVINSVVVGARPRLAEQEVVKWETYFRTLNGAFSWLQYTIPLKGKRPRTMRAHDVGEMLGVSHETVGVWAAKGLLPFLPLSFQEAKLHHRAYLRAYVVGLRAYVADRPCVRRTDVLNYKQNCRARKKVV